MADVDPKTLRIIRATTPEERRTVFQLRYQIFVKELGYPVGGDPEEGLSDPADARAYLVLAYDGDKPVGTLAVNQWEEGLFSPELVESFHLSHFAQHFPPGSISLCHRALVSHEYRGSSLFMQMIHATFLATQSEQSQLVFLDCAPYLVSYYERFGFRRYAPHFLHADTGLLVVPMCLVLSDHVYLEKLGSPLLALVKEAKIPDNPEARAYFARHWTVERPSERREDILALLTPPSAQNRAFDVYDSLLFRGMPQEDTHALLECAAPVSFQKRQVLYATGGYYRELLLLADGYVEISLDKEARKLAIGTCGPGDLLGEVAFILEAPRGAQVTALTDGGALRFSEEALLALFAKAPKLGWRFYQNIAWLLAQRLRGADLSQTECPVH